MSSIDDLTILTNKLIARFPLLATTIMNLNFCYDKITTIAPAYTDGKGVYVTKKFYEDYDIDEQEFIIAHELFHNILRHVERTYSYDNDLLNFVNDGIINQLLVRAGLKMPKDVVNISDALDYSSEELYIKYLPALNIIKKYMSKFTYHPTIIGDDEKEKFKDINDAIDSLKDIFDQNEDLKSRIMDNYKKDLEYASSVAKITSGVKEEIGRPLDTEDSFVEWEYILEKNLASDLGEAVSFYEVQMDGIIKKETKPDEHDIKSEVLIDSSGSMDIFKIKLILKECKELLRYGELRVGFFDTKFYGWHDIYSDNDIDDLVLVGRGENDFVTMAQMFSTNADNKIILTDGLDEFPSDSPDVIWIIISNNCFLPFLKKLGIENVNYILVDEKELFKTYRKRIRSLKQVNPSI